VFISANDPVGSGFVASLAHPGGNITGFIDLEATIGGKWVELVKEMAPHVKQIAALYNPQTHTGQFFKSMETASQSLAVRIIHARFKDASDIDTAFAEFAPEPNSGLIVMPDTSTALHRVTIIVLATRYQLPALYPRRYFINEGGLAYYGGFATDLFRRAAEYGDRILKGAKPSELPVQAPTKFELVINLKTARALGLTIPPTLLARADEVIE